MAHGNRAQVSMPESIPNVQPHGRVSALRALGAAAWTVSEEVVVQRLRGEARGLRGPPVEDLRLAVLISFVLGVHAQAGAVFGSAAETPRVPARLVAPREVSQVVGCSERDAKRILRRLQDTGLLVISGREAELCAEVWEQIDPADEPDWTAVLPLLRGAGAALSTARATAQAMREDGISRLDWHTIAEGRLVELTGYAPSTVRRARARLEESGVLEVRRSDGGANAFRFRAAPLGQAPPPATAPVPPGRAEPAESKEPPVHPLAESGGGGQRLTINGTAVELPVGMPLQIAPEIGGAARLELDSQGRPVLRVGNLVIGFG